MNIVHLENPTNDTDENSIIERLLSFDSSSMDSLLLFEKCGNNDDDQSDQWNSIVDDSSSSVDLQVLKLLFLTLSTGR